MHYQSVIDIKAFLETLRARFFLRLGTSYSGEESIAAAADLWVSLFKGYVHSFGYLWAVILLLFGANVAINGGITWIKQTVFWRYRWLVFVMIVALLENGIMLQHAVAYSFDRMKCIFVLSFLICSLLEHLLRTDKTPVIALALAVSIIAAPLNYLSYSFDQTYRWNAPYRTRNTEIAVKLLEEYPYALFAAESEVRGYLNLLFRRGIFEHMDERDAIEKAIERKKGTIVLLDSRGEQEDVWSMSEIVGVTIINTENETARYYSAETIQSL